jgi:hypothetical protein
VPQIFASFDASGTTEVTVSAGVAVDGVRSHQTAWVFVTEVAPVFKSWVNDTVDATVVPAAGL